MRFTRSSIAPCRIDRAAERGSMRDRLLDDHRGGFREVDTLAPERDALRRDEFQLARIGIRPGGEAISHAQGGRPRA